MKQQLPALVLLSTTVLLSGCAVSDDVPEPGNTLSRELAETPASLTPTAPVAGQNPGQGQASGTPSTDTESAGAVRSDGDSSLGGAGADKGGGGSAPDAPTGPFRTFATLPDDLTDAAPSSPTYAELRSITLQSNEADLRVVVTVGGPLPSRLSDDEVMGIGVDLYRPGDKAESDYQLFVDGEPDGWFAYLQTPRGFVRYPGAFALGGNRLVFTVPLSSVGSPTAGRFSAFVDWTGGTGLVNSEASSDYAPKDGTKPYRRG